MAVVATYKSEIFKGVTSHIRDDYYRNRTREEQERDIQETRRLAWRIAENIAMRERDPAYKPDPKEQARAEELREVLRKAAGG